MSCVVLCCVCVAVRDETGLFGAGEYEEFCQWFVKERGLYIVKPCALSRGRGIFIINSPDQVPLDESHIVSKYIGNPVRPALPDPHPTPALSNHNNNYNHKPNSTTHLLSTTVPHTVLV